MKMSFSGWRHHDKVHRFLNGDISDLKPSNSETYSRDKIYLVAEEDDLLIIAGADDLKLTGNFLIEIRLTRKDIGNLASIAFRDESFSKAVNTLSKRGCTVTAENKKQIKIRKPLLP